MKAECCICVAPVDEQSGDPGDPVQHPVATRCGHLFHSTCIARWLKHKSICPCCKKKCTQRSDIFRIYLDSSGPAGGGGGADSAGSATDPVDLDGGNDVETRALLAHTKRRYEMLEAEVQAAKGDAERSLRHQTVAEAGLARRAAEIEQMQKDAESQALLHNYDRDEAHRWKQAHEKLRQEHTSLQQEYSTVMNAEELRARATLLANGEGEYDPAVDKPQVLKWCNGELRRQKEEYKRQVAELGTAVMSARRQAETAEAKAARRQSRLEKVMEAHLSAKAQRGTDQQAEQAERSRLAARCEAAETALAAAHQVPGHGGGPAHQEAGHGRPTHRAASRSLAAIGPKSMDEDEWAVALAQEEEAEEAGGKRPAAAPGFVPESPPPTRPLHSRPEPLAARTQNSVGWQGAREPPAGRGQRGQKRPRFGG